MRRRQRVAPIFERIFASSRAPIFQRIFERIFASSPAPLFASLFVVVLASCASSTPAVEQAAPPAAPADAEPIQTLIEIDPKPQLAESLGPPCGEGAAPPERATLVVLLHDAEGTPVTHAAARVDPCCDGACEESRADGDGRIVVDACPAKSGDVIVSFETNPRWFKYTPPRPARICAAITEIDVLVEAHPVP